MTNIVKDLQERNHLVRWGILIGLTFFSLATLFILAIDFKILRDPDIIQDHHFRILLFILVIYFTIYATSGFIRSLARYLNNRYLARFTALPKLSCYQESCTRNYFPNKPYDHIVILLHGFTASPQEFQFLIKHLEANQIPYLSPNIIGFGISSTHLLSLAHRHDWYRTAIEQYDLASSLANKVSIVGHSMGGILATFVAMHRPLHHLILSGPGLYSAPGDLKYKRLLALPIISQLYIKIVPYLPKPIRKGRRTTSDTLDQTHTSTMFQYLAIPIHCVKEVFSAQNDVDIQQAQFNQLSIIYGQHDLTVDMNKLFKQLDNQDIPYQKANFENSAHNVLEDYDKDPCCQYIIHTLMETTPSKKAPATSKAATDG
ncbi:acetoin dehydrogenase E2 subunit dihydrolipoyllysine-residue acetyltransferase [Piscirickettsia salmonis]|uniref:Serine aminopeptidase, S33 n=1 Tax=Piscirickettsia salmonis TaxID=1238 RepID=A0A1L6TEA4_PISSA|nr:alpha/beta fold hydrolase [Piscirickettsia salmonis]AKP72779.1 hypothetical protein PSLF89_664 [Piscirickettsia salmonis LF-89 = ATCC VR-1361]ALB23713.1 Serine aminopeptidase, S33 [Piscirickettsia salmonis]ALY03565.1 hypothetical protein AWE47_12480 [Piscirickettsia salmonis]AOS35601.1 hypothetical protein AVM72_09835 [Piscirickettsia salmonis]APS60301.1 hypothetical protein AVI53_06760 [Piscirickettsia salmonis]